MIYQSKMTVGSVELVAKIVKAICSEFGITIDELSKNQKVNQYASKQTTLTSYARTIAMALLSKHFKQQDVANMLNCTNHSTVSSACRRIELLVDVNPLVGERYDNILSSLNMTNRP
jgi:chromosomal replication initiation ATPase DnaA